MSILQNMVRVSIPENLYQQLIECEATGWRLDHDEHIVQLMPSPTGRQFKPTDAGLRQLQLPLPHNFTGGRFRKKQVPPAAVQISSSCVITFDLRFVVNEGEIDVEDMNEEQLEHVIDTMKLPRPDDWANMSLEDRKLWFTAQPDPTSSPDEAPAEPEVHDLPEEPKPYVPLGEQLLALTPSARAQVVREVLSMMIEADEISGVKVVDGKVWYIRKKIIVEEEQF